MADGLWTWFHESTEQAVLTEDRERLHLINLHHRFWHHLETAPQYSLTLLDEGVTLAQSLNAPCWELFHHYWRTELLLFYTQQMDKALESAISGVVKAGKPAYRDCAVVGDVYRILVDSHTWIDPAGYQDKIHQTIQHMRTHMALDTETSLVLIAREVQVAEATGDDDTALQLAQHYLSKSDDYIFQRVHAWQYLTRILYRQGDKYSALNYAVLLEQTSRENDYRLELCVALASLARITQEIGKKEQALVYYHRAIREFIQLRSVPTPDFFDALCGYLIATENIETAINLREQQIKLLLERHTIHHECEARLAYYQLLYDAGKPHESALDAAKESAQHLKKPDRYLTRLAKIAGASQS
ncbi:MAG: tetratricopeptide repeat protein [Aggregatilineales bacterium]